jgi:8-oxo-dGTP pyrophosphatase MutT (NUDIX family)
VLLRDAPAGLEVLLLRRNERAGFVPGAYVFPGGRVDPGDAAPETLARVDGLTPARAAERLGLATGDPPAIAFYVAALREAFEETGVLVGVDPPVDVGAASEVREELLADRIGYGEGLTRLRRRVSAGVLEYLAHWITPERAPRRYDTRFFAARVPAGSEVAIDPREMTSALWITPARAVRAAADDELPMILPTVRTLEQLADFRCADDVLMTLPGLEVPTILPGARPTGSGL